MSMGANDMVLVGPSVWHIPLLERLEPAARAGFTMVSVTPGDIWALEEQGMKAAQITRRIADAGLEVSDMECIGCWLPSQRAAASTPDAAMNLLNLEPEPVLDAAARVGAKTVAVVDMIAGANPHDVVVEAFANICDLAAERGLKAQIEWLPFGGIPDLPTAWSIVQASGRANAGLTVDSGHFFNSCATLDQLAAIPGSRVHSVQINDAPTMPTTPITERRERMLPGEGGFDLTGFIQTLDRIGSTAPIGVEIFNMQVPTQDIETIAQTWAAAGRRTIDRARRKA
jgi:sugar phosphate isomerase/epimerase